METPLHLVHPVVRPGEESHRITLDQAITALAADRMGRTVALGTHRGPVMLYDAATGVLRQKLTGHHRRVHALAFSPSGAHLVSVARDGSLRRWALQESAGSLLWQGQMSLNTCATNGDWIVAAGDDGIIRAWLGGALQFELHGHRGMVTAVALHPELPLAVSGGIDGQVLLWDLIDESGQRLYHHDGAVTACAVSPDGCALVTAGTDGRMQVWDIDSARTVGVLDGHDGPVTACAFAEDNNQLLSGSSDRTVMIWDLATGQRKQAFCSHEREILSVAWSGEHIWSASADRTARAWRPEHQPETPAYRLRHPDAITHCCVTPDGQELISASLDYTLRVWDLRSGQCRQILRGHRGAVSGATLSPSGRNLASVSNDGEVRLWSRNAEGWRAGLAIAAHQDALEDCRFLSNELLLTVGRDGSARAWSLLDGRPLFSLIGHDGSALACAIHPDGRILTAGADGTIIVWSSGQILHRIRAHAAPITACKLHIDGKRMATAGLDRAVRIWDLDRPRLLDTDISHTNIVNDIAMMSNERLVSAGEDGALIMHHLQTGAREKTDLHWPLRALHAHRDRLVVGDAAGNLWIFNEQRATAAA
ncbi:MAG: WD40 repeat domain-containing protein [Myxococcota bacterium]